MAEQPFFWDMFQPNAEIADPEFGTLRFEQRTIGRLNLPSGRIVACDALIDPQPTPFGLEIAPGYYPVRIAIGRFANGDERIAAAMLQVVDEEPADWGAALLVGQHPESVDEEDLPGYGVDSGSGSFLSLEAAEFLASRLDEAVAAHIAGRMEENYRHTRAWADILLDPARALNAIIFSSGLGDGAYPSFWGISADGRPLCLITEFGVAQPPEEGGTV